VDYAEDGDLSAFDAIQVSEAAGWTGDAGEFLQALLQCGGPQHSGFLERDGDTLRVHDWSNYAGRLIERREANRERQRVFRAAHVLARRPLQKPLQTSPPTAISPSEVIPPAKADLPPEPEQLTDPVSLAVQAYIAGHQDNFGGMGPSLVQTVRDFLEEWPAPGPPVGWVTEAIQEACANNVRKWPYVKKVLESWRDNGRQNAKKGKAKAPVDYTGGKYAHLVNPSDTDVEARLASIRAGRGKKAE